MIYTLKNDKLTVEINSLGAELTSVKSTDGHEYIWQGSEWKKHAPILFPVCGRDIVSKYLLEPVFVDDGDVEAFADNMRKGGLAACEHSADKYQSLHITLRNALSLHHTDRGARVSPRGDRCEQCRAEYVCRGVRGTL